MNTKRLLLAIILTISLFSCTKKETEEPKDTSHGPVTTQDTETVEEKILRMIQSAISDYNEGLIEEREETLKTSITKLPIEIEQLPAVNSLDELTPVEDNHDYSNAEYVGSYIVNDKYNVIFKIYHPTGGSYWLNGEVLFEVDPNKVEKDNPAFSEYKNVLDQLLSNELNVVNYLYGLNVSLDTESVLDDQYYEVVSFDGVELHSIDELKAYAETVFTQDYLNEYFYPNAFNAEFPIYKEQDNKLYCYPTEITPLNLNQYDTSYIVAVREGEGDITINLLTTVMNEVQPEIKEIHLLPTENGYRLKAAV